MADKTYIQNAIGTGCDFLVSLPEGRRPCILQLTDMQVIDAAQRRYPDRLNEREIACWATEQVEGQCYAHIRSLVAQTQPDLIFITGDVIYGEFDDSGKSLTEFCAFMDSFGIPWAPVFGNHDNECARGVAWQCDQFEGAQHCLFRRGTVTGHGNYTVGVSVGGRLCRVLYMMDSNGCGAGTDPALYRRAGFAPDQLTWLAETAADIRAPGFVAFHIPTTDVIEAAQACGYGTNGQHYVIGVDAPAQNGDFGCHREVCGAFASPEGFRDLLHSIHADGVFMGHCHAINTSILWDGIRWTFGLKTGQYDYHIPGHIGGTLITLSPDAYTGAVPDNSNGAPFVVQHIPSLTLYAPFPNGI